MHTCTSLQNDLQSLRLDPKGTTLAHFSYKKMGEVEGGAETVIDALLQYMEGGLMVFPTHTWATINREQPYYSTTETESTIGIIPELARKREGGFRSSHPTHSVVAFGPDAQAFAAEDHLYATPCARHSSWGKLLDRNATILLIGVGLNRDTFIHGVEEWLDIPNRLSEKQEIFYSRLADGTLVPVFQHRHINEIGENFGRAEHYLREQGVLKEGRFGDAVVLYHQTQPLFEALQVLLTQDPDFFGKR